MDEKEREKMPTTSTNGSPPWWKKVGCGTVPGMAPALREAYVQFLGDYEQIKEMGDECPAGTFEQLWEAWEFLIRPIYSGLTEQEMHFEASEVHVKEIRVVVNWINGVAGVRSPSPVHEILEITGFEHSSDCEGCSACTDDRSWKCGQCGFSACKYRRRFVLDACCGCNVDDPDYEVWCNPCWYAMPEDVRNMQPCKSCSDTWGCVEKNSDCCRCRPGKNLCRGCAPKRDKKRKR